MNTLWDLVRSFIVSPLQRSERSSPIASRSSPRRRPAMAKRAPRKRKSGLISNDALSVSPMHAAQERPSTTLPAGPMQDRYDAMVRMMLDRYGVRVRKWRSSMSGVAWELAYADGRRVKLLESPKPKGPMSAAIFLHEIGHHAIGLGVYRPRCLEEYHAWAFATLRQLGSAFELAALHLKWLGGDDENSLRAQHERIAIDAFESISANTKTLLMKCARAAHTKRVFDAAPLIGEMTDAWDRGMLALERADVRC